ncbi:MAG: phage holin, LLH family [Candidatus Caldatribacteriaceae bacterium]
MLFDILILIFPALVSIFLLGFLKSERDREIFLRILKLAEEAVLFVEDAFPNSPGVEKLQKAIQYLQGALAKSGLKLSNSELEAKVRSAYQRLQQDALANLLRRFEK